MRLTITDKKIYCERLKAVLQKPSFDELKKAYTLFTTEASETNIRKVARYCDNHSYFKLSLLDGKIKWGGDELGEVPISDFLDLYY